MFELTNEQRKCFGIPPVLDTWRKVVVEENLDDGYATYAYLDGQKIIKVVKVSEKSGDEHYLEYALDQMLSEDGTKILPKTDKGKPQKFTLANLTRKTPVGMRISYVNGSISLENYTNQQIFYLSCYEAVNVVNIKDFSKWVDNWCQNTGEKELAEITEFSNRKRTHQKFKEGDFFRYRINRTLFGYGRILVDYEKMRKDGIAFWDVFMGKPLCVAVYHIVTEDKAVKPEQLVQLKMLPSQMIMDDIFYYGECEIIGNMPISLDEDNFTIHYGRSRSCLTPYHLYYQCGKIHVALEGEKALEFYNGDKLYDFSNIGIGWILHATLPILLECIKKGSNDPYWNMITYHRANEDLRNPKFEKELKQIKKQMGVE